MAAIPAASVDVTKHGWWLTPYKATKQWTIGVSYTDVSISYIAALQKAVQNKANKAKEMGVKIIEVDAKNDTNIELSNVENLLQQKVDLLLFEGASLKASGASIEAANKANVPVVHFNILGRGRPVRNLCRLQPDRFRQYHGQTDCKAVQGVGKADPKRHLPVSKHRIQGKVFPTFFQTTQQIGRRSRKILRPEPAKKFGKSCSNFWDGTEAVLQFAPNDADRVDFGRRGH